MRPDGGCSRGFEGHPSLRTHATYKREPKLKPTEVD